MTLAIRTWIVVALVTLAGAAGAAPATSVGCQSARFPGPGGRVIELSIHGQFNRAVAAFFAAALEAK
jgi:hypothetical protein